MIKPKLPLLPATSSLVVGDPRALSAESTIENVCLKDIDFTQGKAPNSVLEESIIDHGSFIDARLEKVHMTDVEISKSNLSALHSSEGSFIRVRIRTTRLTGVDLSRALIKDVVLEDCVLDMANFRFATLRNVVFSNCTLRETDFQAATLERVAFKHCHIQKADFSGITAKTVDLRTSELFDIRGWQSLKGVTIDSTQLMTVSAELALAMGIVVED